jgi:hypothetical protein
MLNACLSPDPVSLEDHFGVRPGAEDLSANFQVAPNLPEIADLAVEGDLSPTLGILHRLAPGGEHLHPLAIRPTMGHGAGHGLKSRADSFPVLGNDARYPAHGFLRKTILSVAQNTSSELIARRHALLLGQTCSMQPSQSIEVRKTTCPSP